MVGTGMRGDGAAIVVCVGNGSVVADTGAMLLPSGLRRPQGRA